ncbi:unnamed protein product [Symbiodinium sp. KB8]|nr:unnamed protein product [Symbiodinium sp. KB8]
MGQKLRLNIWSAWMNYVLARSASRATLSLFRPTTRIVNGQGRPEGLPPFVQTDDRRRFHFIAHGGTTVRSVVLRCVLGFRTDTCSLTTRPHAWRAGTTFARCLQRAFCSQCKRQRQRVGARDFLSAPLESHCEDGSKPPRPAWTPPLARAFSSDLDPASRAVLSQAGPPKKMRTGYAMSASIGDKKPNNGEEEEAMPPSTIGSIGPGGGGPAGPGAGDDSKKPPSHRGGPKGGDPPGPPSYAPTDEGVADVTEVKISRREADKVIVPPFPKVTQEVHQQQDKDRYDGRRRKMKFMALNNYWRPEFYKRKARLVMCGNFQTRQAEEDSYAGGCQTDSLRVMLVHCAAKGWLIASTDIRNAFILAPIKDEEDDEDEVYALYAPKVFQLARVQYALRLWRVDRALKGFRRQGYGGPEVEVTVGYVNVYVDDLLYTSERRFLGLEIGRTESGGVRLHQRGRGPEDAVESGQKRLLVYPTSRLVLGKHVTSEYVHTIFVKLFG